MFGFGSSKKKDNSAPKPPAPPGGSKAGKAAVNQQQAGAVLNQPVAPPAPAAVDPDADTEQELGTHLGTLKDAEIETLVRAGVTDLKTRLNGKLSKIVEGQKKAILAEAKAKVEEDLKGKAAAKPARDPIAPRPAGDAESQLDASKIVSESDAWDQALKSAETKAQSDANTKEATFTTDGAKAFTDYKPVGALKKSQRDAHLEKAKLAAKTAIDAAVKAAETSLMAEANKVPAKEALISSAKTNASTAGKEQAETELEKREEAGNEADVVAAADKPVKDTTESILEEQKKWVGNRLGATGTHWYMSSEFKAFHKRMKARARDLGHEATDAEIAKQRPGGARTAQFEHQAAVAQVKTHDGAKVELREVIKGLANETLKTADGNVHVEDRLANVGKAAAWGKLREKTGTADKRKTDAGKAAAAAVKGARSATNDALNAAVLIEAEKIIKAKAAGKTDDVAQQEKDDQIVTEKVKPAFNPKDSTGAEKPPEQQFGKKMMKQAIEAQNPHKGLQFIAGLIDAAAPQPGDETELQVELKIPATHGAFVYLTVTGTAARNKHMEVGIDIGFGAGWETWGLSARGGFNVFLKAGAADTVTAMQLIHYGAFRNLAQVNNGAANFWAGAVDPSETGKRGGKQIGKTEQAELYAAQMEDKAFKTKDDFVEVGGGVGAQAKLNAGIGVEGSARFTTALRWDKDVIDGAKPKTDAMLAQGLGDREATAQAKRDAVNAGAKRVNKLKFTTAVEAEAAGQKFSIGIEAERAGKPVGTPGADWTIQLAGGIPYDAGSESSSTVFSKIAGSYVPAAMGGVKKIYDMYKARNPTAGETVGDGSAKGEVAGGGIDATQDLILGLDAGGMTNNLLKSMSEANPQGLDPSQADGTNDTARLWLGKDMGMKDGMGDKGDMSKLTSDMEKPKAFGMTSQLQIQCILEFPEGGKPKITFKVMRQKELKMGGELGAGIGLSAKITKKQELAGVSKEKGEAMHGWMGGRNQA